MGDHALIKWNQIQECMIITTLLVRMENIRKFDFSGLSDLKNNSS